MKKKFLSLSLVLALAASLVCVAANDVKDTAKVADSEITVVDNDVIETGDTNSDLAALYAMAYFQSNTAYADKYVKGASVGVGPNLAYTMDVYHGNNTVAAPSAQIMTTQCVYPFGIHAYSNWSGDVLYNAYCASQAASGKANVQAPSTAKVVVVTYDNSDPWYIARYALANGMVNYVPSDIDGIYYYADRGYIHVQVWQ